MCPEPTKSACTWCKAGFGDDKLTVYYFDRRFAPGYIYVGVYGATDSEFSIKSWWKEVGVDNENSKGSVEESHVGKKKPDDRLDTLEVARDMLRDAPAQLQDEALEKFRTWK